MLIDKNNLPLVAMDFMNDVHIEDVIIINDLYELILSYENNPSKKNEEEIDKKYMQWYNHTVRHFQGEEKEMLSNGFPPFQVHKFEHDNALEMMNEKFTQWQDSRDINALKKYINSDLISWLINHIQTMDTVTAMFLKTGMSPCSMG
eukprot:TRINITY_DN301471_c1_g1_i1.p1 TRINITY_DN301471_c1_g1~~TRINITY_DN301471_c1_g1_i1.p1  ORF type:complete len:147 (+),score=14.36 TRINITY_DN301471_c1_g1_i1:124-564(+)